VARGRATLIPVLFASSRGRFPSASKKPRLPEPGLSFAAQYSSGSSNVVTDLSASVMIACLGLGSHSGSTGSRRALDFELTVGLALRANLLAPGAHEV
jgi:hypothetical protein